MSSELGWEFATSSHTLDIGVSFYELKETSLSPQLATIIKLPFFFFTEQLLEPHILIPHP